MVAIGQMRARVRIEHRVAVDDGYGNTQGDWLTVMSGVPAKIGPLKGGEEVRSSRIAGFNNFDIVIRGNPTTAAITSEHRLVNERNGETYNIKWIGNFDERGRFLTLTCQSGVNHG